jgi:lipopolysaccharide/colanic/teichoic acid biosynthesis glycosyltransferase
MFVDAERKTGPVWAKKDDPRITNIGSVLRRWHLDELPQLLNILLGDMRFIGPRPERPCFVSEFAPQIPGYDRRFSVKPGLTGWAQINCGYDQTIESVKKKLIYDVDYIDNKNSITNDVKILFQTGVYLLTGKTLIKRSRERKSELILN